MNAAGRGAEAGRFADLYHRRLLSLPVVTRRWHVLSFLYALARDGDGDCAAVPPVSAQALFAGGVPQHPGGLPAVQPRTPAPLPTPAPVAAAALPERDAGPVFLFL